MKPANHCCPTPLFVLLVTLPALGAPVSWDAGGDGVSWGDAKNWSADTLPGAADDVTIGGLGTNVTITLGAEVTVRSLQCSASLKTTSGDLMLTGGASQIAGVLTIGTGRSLTVKGATTTLTVAGSASLPYADLYALEGAVLSFSHLSTLNADQGTCQAMGVGSRISFPVLATAALGTKSWFNLYAHDGGRVELPVLATLPDGYLNVLADEPGSVVDLSALAAYQPAVNHYGQMEARAGGTVLVAALALAPRTRFTLYANATFALPALTNLTGGSLEVVGTGAITLTTLTNVDDVNLYATDGGVLSFPNVRNCRTATATWQARGANSRLVLTNLSSAVFGTVSWQNLYAHNGGHIELPSLPALPDGYVNLTADGTGSEIDLSALQSYQPSVNRYGQMEAKNGGTILVPTLALAPRTAFTMHANSSLALPALTNLTGGSLEAVGVGTFTMNVLTNLNEVDLYATDGAVMSFPNVTTCRTTAGVWQATGLGSRLVLANLASVTLGTTSWMNLYARAGGRLELGAVPALPDGYVNVLADGAGSVVDLSTLRSYQPAVSHYGQMEAKNGGTILAPALTLAPRTRFTIAADSTFALPVLTNLFGGSLKLTGAGTFNLTVLTNLDEVELHALEGAVVSFPNVTACKMTTGTWQAAGAGSRLVLANLSSAALGTTGWQNLYANDGGRLELPALPALPDGYVNVLADGTDSVVDLSGLESYSPAMSHYGQMEAKNGGVILLSALGAAPRTTFTMHAGAGLALPALTNLSGGGLSAVGVGAFNLTVLTNLDNVDLAARDGAVLSFPNVQFIRSTAGTWEAAGAGSRLVLANLAEASLGAGGWMNLYARGGGRLELAALTALSDGYLNVLADGTDSVVELSSLNACKPALNQYGQMEAKNEGTILVPVLGQALRMRFTIHLDSHLALPVLTNLFGGSLTAIGAGALTMSQLANLDEVDLAARDGAVLSFPNAQRIKSTSGTWEAVGAGSRLVLANLAEASLGTGGWMNFYARDGGRLELATLTGLADGYINLLADGTDSVVDLSQLSGLVLRQKQGQVVAKNGGVILFNEDGMLLSNVSIDIPAGNPVLPPTVTASPSLSLYGKAWHSYWIEVRDATDLASEWNLLFRVPLTNDLQVLTSSPARETVYRVHEFVADPPLVDLWLDAPKTAHFVIYGKPGASFHLEAAAAVPAAPAGWTPWGTSTGVMTNSFRITPTFETTGTRQFFRARQE